MAHVPSSSGVPDRPFNGRRSLRRIVNHLLAAAVVACAALLPAAPAQAAPSVDEIEAQIDKQWEQLEPTIEQYNKVHNQLVVNRKKSTELQNKIQPLSLQTALAFNRIGDLANRYYKVGPSAELNAILTTGKPATLVDQLTMLDRMAADEHERIAGVIVARDKFNAEKTKLDALIEQQARLDAELAGKKKQIDTEINRLQKLRLTVASSSNSSLYKGPCPAVYPGGAAGKAVSVACAQIGKWYVWGATGPNTFDCSGLTQYAWGKAGVHLTHFTGAQWNEGRAVSRADARPGDLVFFYGDLHHVGMYVGNGLMVHAPRTGKPVQMASIDVMPVAGFRRPG